MGTYPVSPVAYRTRRGTAQDIAVLDYMSWCGPHIPRQQGEDLCGPTCGTAPNWSRRDRRPRVRPWPTIGRFATHLNHLLPFQAINF